MSQEIISKETKDSLEILKRSGLLNDFYLAGGTALALQANHRFSDDLDFFTQKEFNPEILLQKIKGLGSFSVEKLEELTLIGIFNKTKISFLGYNYPLLKSLKEIEGTDVADISDVGCMKLSAICSRAAKKDFIDLFFIIKQIPLKELLILFQTKYAEVNFNQTHLLKSLTYFEDAENNPMPEMIIPVSWGEVKRELEKAIK